MADLRLPGLLPTDPRNCLSVSARQRLSDVQLEAEKIRKRAFVDLEMRYRSEEKPVKPFSTYLSVGQAAIEFEVATIAAARLMLSALVREYKAAGKTGRELRAIMDEEVEAIVTSAEMPAIQRDLLTLELDLHKYEVNPPANNVALQPGAATIENSPAGQTDNTYENDRRVAEKIYFQAQVTWLERLVSECRSLPRLDNPTAVLWKTAATAIRGGQPESQPKRELDFRLVLELAGHCVDFGKAELLAYAGLLRRLGVPASQAVVKAEQHAEATLVELRCRKWAVGVDHMKSWYSSQEIEMGWQAIKADIGDFSRDALEQHIWLAWDGWQAASEGASVGGRATNQSDDGRRSKVNDFLFRCKQATGITFNRKHIWKAAGHTASRQFEFWQASSPKATAQDDRNFERILAMSPQAFQALLEKRNIT